MKKISLFVLLSFITVLKSYSQADKKNLDFIIVVDDDITVGSIASLQIKVLTGGKQDIVNASYYPGNLSLSEVDYSRLMSDSTTAIYLKFALYEYARQDQNTFSYEIELKKAWLKDYFNILRIYDLDKRKYRRRFVSRGVGRNYVYELQSPSHAFQLIERKSH